MPFCALQAKLKAAEVLHISPIDFDHRFLGEELSLVGWTEAIRLCQKARSPVSLVRFKELLCSCEVCGPGTHCYVAGDDPHRGGGQLLGAADAQTAHAATFSTAPTHQLLGSANAETTPARAPAAGADRKQRPDATCEGKNA